MLTSTLLPLLSLAIAFPAAGAHTSRALRQRDHGRVASRLGNCSPTSPEAYLAKELVLEKGLVALQGQIKAEETAITSSAAGISKLAALENTLKEDETKLKDGQATMRELRKERLAAIASANAAKTSSWPTAKETLSTVTVTTTKTVCTMSPTSKSIASKAVASKAVASKAVVSSSSKAVVASSKTVASASSKKGASSSNSSKAAATSLVPVVAIASLPKSSAPKTSSASAKATATAASTSTKKKGLGYNTASITNAFGSSIGWAYNWAAAQDTSTGTLASGVEFCPMLWGASSVSGWSAAANTGIEAGSSHLLGFNEPDLSTQSNLSPSDAATLWKANMEPFADKASLISPAITNGGAPMGVAWLTEFLSDCTGCTISAVAAHWYDSATNTAYFTNYLTDLHNTTGKPIWLTEFMGSGTVAEQQTFFEYVIPWMESKSWIQRYAAFGDFAGTFVDSTGALTDLGTTYKNAA